MQTLSEAQLRILREFPLGRRPNKLSLALELAGLTQAEFARAVNLTQPYVSDLVRGRFSTITLGNARKIADYFGAAVEDIFPARVAVAS